MMKLGGGHGLRSDGDPPILHLNRRRATSNGTSAPADW